jgi:hypothetical protein
MLLVALLGCKSPHNPFIVTAQTTGEPRSSIRYAGHTNKVFVTEEPLPSHVTCELLESIEVGKVWYGSSRDVKKSMADRARMIGAHAVVEVKTWHQPAGWSWAAPHGSGKAVRFPESGPRNLSTLHGEWY